MDTSAPTTPNGTRRFVDGQLRVHYDGYWIKTYEVPADTLAEKRRLIEALTRRLFNHVEHGINIPGHQLSKARRAFDSEEDPAHKRVKGAMLAGALFNRATDIITKLVEIQALGVEIQSDNALLRECGRCLQEALELGKLVRHISGEEGIDELWGEPLRAFSIPVEEFFESRYIKIAQAMRDIDRIADGLVQALAPHPLFAEIDVPVRRFAGAAKIKSETLRTDAVIFDVWADFVVAGERLEGYAPRLSRRPSPAETRVAGDGMHLVASGKSLVTHVTRARVPMPKSTAEFLARCEAFGRLALGRREDSREAGEARPE